ncbi:MAG: UDP-N-acetylmuramoylalanyl-D-glutamyl-2,6-diaminopimelate--D-alanyl-D-alanine ligase [Pseudomonadota bacterium]
MTVLWTREDLVAATGGRAEGEWTGVTGIAIDNREMDRGDLFIALKGISHDGHVYAAKALAAGAAAAMVSHRPEDLPADAPVLVVEDTLKALEDLGHAGRARTGAKVLAVTGSVGKTSTKDMMRTMLAPQGRTHAAIRSFNNHWGVPLTLARMPAETDFAVIEIGMNHPGEITPLSRMARPDVALITTVEAVHLAAFDSVEQIADAKAEIFAGLGPEGIAVLNVGNPHFARLSDATSGHEIVAFGEGQAAFSAISIHSNGTSTAVRAEVRGQPLCFRIGTPGAHFALNALGALAVIDAAGADITIATETLAAWTPPDGRGYRTEIPVPGGAILLLDESYNANPASMRAALGVLSTAPATGRRQAFLGDMLELGPTETALHKGLADLPEISDVDTIHCCGPLMRTLHDALPVDKRGLWCADSQELAAEVGKVVDAGDACMVKGSLGARMSHVVRALRDLGTNAPAGPDGDA